MSEQLELISSAFKVIETQRPKLACCRCDHIVQAPVPSKPIARSYAGAGSWPMSSPENMQTICRYTASQRYTAVRVWS
ncbi:IS66 family element, transposase domain protein [Escherichia coli 3.2303]|nr:IS66 family element, transposase domain protein [Escherichia coli 3.2303]